MLPACTNDFVTQERTLQQSRLRATASAARAIVGSLAQTSQFLLP
jgi:hypothetical protein